MTRSKILVDVSGYSRQVTKILESIFKLELGTGCCQHSRSIQDQGRSRSREHFHALDVPVLSEGGDEGWLVETNVNEGGGEKRK